MASGEGISSALDDDKNAEKMVNDLICPSRDECSLPLAPVPPPASRGPEPWALSVAAATHATQQDETPSAKGYGYRDLLRSRGRAVMQGSYCWRPFTETEVTADDNLPVAQALGLMWNAAGATTCPAPSVAHSPFHDTLAPTTPSGQFVVQHELPPMPPPMSPMMLAPTMAFEKNVDQLLAIAMPGFLAGLSNLQIEEQLRAAASQIDVYDD